MAGSRATKRRPRRKVIRTLDDFYATFELEDIVYTDLHSWRPDEEDETPRAAGRANLDAGFHIRSEETELVVDLRALLWTEHWNYQVAVQVTYNAKTPISIGPDMMEEVLNRSTIASALPFLRGGVMDLATRVRDLPIPVMPLAGPSTKRYFTRDE